MEVTYGYDMKGEETFVASMQRATDIFFSIAARPEIFAVCTAFPFGGLPFDLVPFGFFFYMRTMQ